MLLQNASITVKHFIIGGFDTVKRPVAVGVVMLIIYILAIFANTVNILFIIFDKRLHKPMYLLVCNLAVVDIMYTSSATPTMIGVLLADVKTIYVDCLIQMCVFHLAMYGTPMERFALAIMAFDRLIAIIFPFHYHSYLTNTRTVVLTYILWIIGCGTVVLFPATVIPLPHCTLKLKYTFCDYAAIMRTTCVNVDEYFNQSAIWSFFILFFTFTFICISYCGILFCVKLSSNNDKKKMGSTVVSHAICVTCFYSPIFIIVILTRVGVVLSLDERQGLLIGNILGPSLVNPFVYCLRTTEIKNKMVKIFKKILRLL
ncbi:olfactory receptor 508-like [Astatotilapia calliptera]|uniref:olfactory receptor 508-like n=1 Tax=Astatotilapia calliptera TaxID=8154 RepID=UPI000E404C3C|nr:olfactory receptor 508-like [Astatotilapia calliptera]